VVWLSAPVQWLTVTVLDGVINAWREYIYLVDVQEENEALRAEVAALENAVQRREEYRLENERLRTLVELHRRAPDAQVAFAYVIATSPTPLFRSLRVQPDPRGPLLLRRDARRRWYRGRRVGNGTGASAKWL